MRHAIYIPLQRTAIVYESEKEFGTRREICRREVPPNVWRGIVESVRRTVATDPARAERLAAIVETGEGFPDALAIFNDTAGKSAFNVPGHAFVRRIANGSAVSYVCRDGSRFVVSDARGYHAVVDRDGNEWNCRPSACVARGTAKALAGYYGTTNHGQD